MNLQKKKLFLLDMDGTIYLDQTLFEGTLDFLSAVRKNGGRYVFLTNNSSKSTSAYIEKLSNMGVFTSQEDYLTSTDALIQFLAQKQYHRIYAFGTASFREQLRLAGFPVTAEISEDIDCLCIGFDTELTFQKLEDACILLNRGVDFIATNPDWVCPTWYGFVPDCGSVSEMLFRATGRRPKFIGKPEPEMPLLAISKFGFQKEDAVLIGDRLYTDIACGVNAGISTILVLSGETNAEDLEKSEIQPEAVYQNIQTIFEDYTKNPA